MDVYVKSFNRPYLLHRTLASIKTNLIGFDGDVIVLDDGTPENYLNRIKELFPEVQIRKSPYYEEKNHNILTDKIPEKIIPADFWRDEMLKGTEYFILLEDDMWFGKPVNFLSLKEDIYRLKMDMVKFMWLENKRLISDVVKESTDLIHKIEPKVLTKNSFLFDSFFRTNRWKLSSVIKKRYDLNEELLKYYQLYIVAGGVFSKRYYETCWKSDQNKVDELKQISQLLKSKKTFNVGNTKTEILKATYKTTATLMAKENLGVTVDIFKINAILNNAWYLGNYYDICKFECDLPSFWIEENIESFSENGSVLVQQWQQWYGAFKESYKNIGCNI